MLHPEFLLPKGQIYCREKCGSLQKLQKDDLSEDREGAEKHLPPPFCPPVHLVVGQTISPQSIQHFPPQAAERDLSIPQRLLFYTFLPGWLLINQKNSEWQQTADSFSMWGSLAPGDLSDLQEMDSKTTAKEPPDPHSHDADVSPPVAVLDVLGNDFVLLSGIPWACT